MVLATVTIINVKYYNIITVIIVSKNLIFLNSMLK